MNKIPFEERKAVYDAMDEKVCRLKRRMADDAHDLIRRTDVVGKITSAEMQAQFREMSGSEAYTAFIPALNDAPTIDAVSVVRCEKCLWYKPAHFRADDGTETPWDGTISLGMSDGRKGIYIGGKCKHERNTSYGETDKAFRKPYHFCSFGERRSE